MIIQTSGWFHKRIAIPRQEYHYFQYPNQTSICGILLATDKNLAQGHKSLFKDFDHRCCTICKEHYLKLDRTYRQRKGMKPVPIIRTEEKKPEGGWISGACSKCGTLGVFWDGGKRNEHFCHKCMVVMA